jgi:hypothetical protein
MARKRILSILVTIPFLFVLTSPATFAQDRGTITGVVTDPSGAAVPGAKVTARNVATGRTQSTLATSSGDYTIVQLPVGIYSVTVEKTGFRSSVANQVTVAVNTATRVDFKLEVGAVTQSIQVRAAPPLLQTDRTDLGLVLSANQILSLPLSLSGGLRDNLQFVTLTPGTYNAGGGDNYIRIAGGLSAESSQLLDGGESMSGRQNDGGFSPVSVEAIQEFKVQTGSFSAEYGRTANGVENFVTKSGTNQLHGGIFEYFRNTALNARGFYNLTTPVTRQNDFGGTFGGPIDLPHIYNGHNKLFFFFAYEGNRYQAGSPNGLASVPPMAMRSGDFSGWVNGAGQQIPIYDPTTTRIVNGQIVRDQFPGNVIPSGRIDATAQTILGLLPPPQTSSLYNNIHEVGNPANTNNVPSIQIDAYTSNKMHWSGLYSRSTFGSPPQIGPIPGPLGNNFESSGVSDYFRLSNDYTIKPTLLNHFLFSGNWTRYLETQPNQLRSGSDKLTAAEKQAIQLKGIPGDPNAPSEYNFTGDGFAQVNFWVDTDSPDRTWEILDEVTDIHNRHDILMGFEYLHTLFARKDCNQCAGEADFSPSVTGLPGASFQTGSAFASFLLGLPSGGAYNLGGYGHWAAPYYAWFVQDNFKATYKLTINMGLRYELPIPISEKYGNTGNLCFTCPNPSANGFPGAIEFGGIGPGRTGKFRWTNTRTDAFGPRLGVAYLVTPNTVLRAGGGIFYMPEREPANSDTHNTGFAGYRTVSAPNSYTPAFTLAQGFPTPIPSPTIDPGICAWGNPVGCTPWITYPWSGLAPYMGSWNATVQHRFGANTALTVAYQGTNGISLYANRENIMQVDPKYLSLGTVLLDPIDSPAAQAAGIILPYASFPGTQSVAQALRPFPQYPGVNEYVGTDMTGHSTFNALEISVEHQTSHGLWFQAAYTWSKLISNTQGGNPALGGFTGNGDVGTQNEFDRRADKAISPDDIPHRLVISYVYALPVGRGQHFLSNASGITNAVLGGWHVSGVQQYQSGNPMWVNSNQTNGLFTQTERANVNWSAPLINPAWNGDPNAQPYLNPAAFSRPAIFTFGNSPAVFSNLRSPAMLNEDFSLYKDFLLASESRKLTFSANFFNAFNRVQLGAPNNSVESGAFGFISSQRNDPREIQFMLRFQF